MAGDEKAFDVVIIGSGPAGMSAGIWCADLGHEAIVVEGSDEAGGGLLWIHNPITNYPGVMAKNGREMRDIFQRHSQNSGVLMRLSSTVTRIDADQGTVELNAGKILRGRNILVATGVRRRTLGLVGEEWFKGRGILDSGARAPESVLGMNVAVVGGGDAAAENAAILSRFAKRVYLIHRGDKLSARDELAEKALAAPNVTFLSGRNVQQLNGRDALESIDIATRDGKIENIPIERAIFRIGVIPNSELLAGVVRRDKNGYILTDNYGRTDRETIFAAGDVSSPLSPTIVTAAGQAATAIKFIRSQLR